LRRTPWIPRRNFLVHFGNNRRDAGGRLGAHQFSNDLSKTFTYGVASVTIPTEHSRGKLELPLHWWSTRDPKKYFLVESTTLRARITFQQTFAGPPDVLLFVHG
jgi:hypothetical protein